MSALRDIVVKKGLVSEGDLVALDAWPAYRGASLAEKLYRSGVVSDAQLCEAFVSLGATDATADLVHRKPAPAALGALSRALAEKHRAIALRVERSRIIVAMIDPADTDAIEKLSWFCGLAVEPRAVRPRVLFQALADAYAVPLVRPDGAFLARGGFLEPPQTDPDNETLPAPSPDSPLRVFGAVPSTADPKDSPLARAISGEGAPVDDDDRSTSLSLPRRRTVSLRDVRPAATPILDESAIAAIRKNLPPGSPLEARDSLPPQVLRLLVPPMRCAVLFLVRGNVAVGWDGTLGKEAIRDVLLPLTGPSSLKAAFHERHVVMGNAADPTTLERILWRHLHLEPPTAFAVLPILVGTSVHALMYVDADIALDDALVDGARRVGNTLADGLAPFVAAGTLFPPVSDKLRPIGA